MSTRCTIVYDEHNFHLYQECFENDNVYLQLDGEGWSAALDTASVDWRDGESTKPSLALRIDVELWRKIVEGWGMSAWGKNPSVDHSRIDFDPEALSRFFTDSVQKKEEEKKDE
jgi:hypothetical protein